VNVALVCAQVGFGGFNVVGKYALDYVKPVVFAFYREVISGPLLLIIASIVERVIPEKRDWWRLALLGIVLYLNQFCFIMGLKLTSSATQTAIIQQCIPVFTTTIALIIRLEKMSFLKVLGIISAAGGAVVMAGFDDLSLKNAHFVGILLLLGNTMCMSLYYICQKPVLKKYPPITVTGWAYMVGAIEMGITSLAVNKPSAYTIPTEVFLPLGYAIVFATILSYMALTWANTYAPASMVAAYSSLQPLTAALLSFIFLGEVLVWREGLGALFITSGLGLVTYARIRENGSAGVNGDAGKTSDKQTSESINASNGEESPLLGDTKEGELKSAV